MALTLERTDLAGDGSTEERWVKFEALSLTVRTGRIRLSAHRPRTFKAIPMASIQVHQTRPHERADVMETERPAPGLKAFLRGTFEWGRTESRSQQRALVQKHLAAIRCLVLVGLEYIVRGDFAGHDDPVAALGLRYGGLQRVVLQFR